MSDQSREDSDDSRDDSSKNHQKGSIPYWKGGYPQPLCTQVDGDVLTTLQDTQVAKGLPVDHRGSKGIRGVEDIPQLCTVAKQIQT